LVKLLNKVGSYFRSCMYMRRILTL